jgi:hypothetical protein
MYVCMYVCMHDIVAPSLYMYVDFESMYLSGVLSLL